jgi:hypothetical protein
MKLSQMRFDGNRRSQRVTAKKTPVWPGCFCQTCERLLNTVNTFGEAVRPAAEGLRAFCTRHPKHFSGADPHLFRKFLFEAETAPTWTDLWAPHRYEVKELSAFTGLPSSMRKLLPIDVLGGECYHCDGIIAASVGKKNALAYSEKLGTFIIMDVSEVIKRQIDDLQIPYIMADQRMMVLTLVDVFIFIGSIGYCEGCGEMLGQQHGAIWPEGASLCRLIGSSSVHLSPDARSVFQQLHSVNVSVEEPHLEATVRHWGAIRNDYIISSWVF